MFLLWPPPSGVPHLRPIILPLVPCSFWGWVPQSFLGDPCPAQGEYPHDDNDGDNDELGGASVVQKKEMVPMHKTNIGAPVSSKNW